MACQSLSEYLEENKEKFIDECTLCCQCLADCQMLPHTTLQDEDPEALQEERIEYLKTGQFSQKVYDLAYSCTHCGVCKTSCPEDLDPFLLNEIVLTQLEREGKVPEAFSFPDPEEGHNWVDIMGSIQIKPSEIRWFTEVPEDPPQAEVVLFLGCVPYMLLNDVQTVLDIFENMGIDFVAVQGTMKKLCCGGSHLPIGSEEERDSASKNIVKELDRFNPKKVVFYCSGCSGRYQQVILQYIEPPPFQSQHLTEFLSDHLDKLQFVNSVDKRVTYHDSCHLGRVYGTYEAPRRILRAIPGVNLVEMEHSREESICCGSSAMEHIPEACRGLNDLKMKEAEATGAEVLSYSCTACGGNLAPPENEPPLTIESLVTLLGRSLGIEHENKMKTYMALNDVDKILAEARPYIQESIYTEEELRPILAMMFGISGD